METNRTGNLDMSADGEPSALKGMDWPAAGKPRPEQIWLPGTGRRVKV
jgi:hypothetical protein